MAQSFTLEADAYSTAAAFAGKRKVLVTGAAGRIGSYFAEHHDREKYELRLMVRESDEGIDAIRPYGEVVYGNLNDLESLKRAMADIDTVIHLAANASASATWTTLLDTNIIGTYNVFAAAKASNCRRVIFASSIHAVSGYPSDVQIKTSDPVNPGDLYGVSKCFGEALGRYLAEQEGVSCIALRIGAFQPLEAAQRKGGVHMLDAFVSERDLHQLIERCIDANHIRFAIFHGLSDNRFKRMDILTARELVGYAPQDDLTDLNPLLKDLNLSERVIAHNLSDHGQRSGLREELDELMPRD
jgi:NAD(P)-dependent dehydrogenase (short-subunit alcohol dehydrogenase family)